MNKTFKVGILLVILAVPAFIFVFLHSFGKNHFDTQTYYSNGVDSVLTDCVINESGQYRISHSFFSNDSINVFLLNSDPVIHSGLTSTWESWFDAYYEMPVSFKQVLPQSLCLQNTYRIKNIKCVNSNELNELYCDLIVKKENLNQPYGVLVNEDKVIKGYFELNDNKEIDRLFAEIQILLTNYE
ncbi:hypothetical protein OO013_01785 [Mangrovivirga sp. M17]|uniref:Uncharacterized protein n=1 Tax=Mangrovivirga halotolerans TaxID=2993936 RepID=A0ABT3RL79_9BACT|nr:hypothetical protein [Mangrovivirga halotolerans]MCX2742574.1 hypothetical protein [Mangrovivirga halotolerans]